VGRYNGPVENPDSQNVMTPSMGAVVMADWATRRAVEGLFLTRV
jgi:hypothetical protein